MIEYIDLTIDFANRNDQINGITLDRVTTRSYDTAIKFRIEIIGHALDETYDIKILSKYHTSDFKVMTTLGDSLEIVDGKLIYTPKVNLITESDYVRNYLYLSKDGLGLDMAQFNYQVDVSQIGEISLDIRQAYDESYEVLIAEFEQALEDYKLTLPQADSVRAEIDVILNQFGVDSQAKLNQYDTDAQKAIEDNQTAFGVAESGRQSTYEQAESDRNQLSNQAVVDWEQGADALLETVESNEPARVIAESARKTAETDRVSSETTRKTNETTRISNENARKSAEDIRLANELNRVNAENVRSEFYEGFGGRLDGLESERMVLKNNLNAPTFLGFSQTFDGSLYNLTVVSSSSSSPRSAFTFKSVPSVGDKLYTCLYSKTVMSAVYRVLLLGNTTIVNPPREDALLFLSGVITYEIGNALFKYESGVNTVVGDTGQISKAIQINLTETFGAGNEPSKAEIDELIKITGYFDEITLSKQQLLTWQLNLIRQNRNALIALGGTII